jgi:capsular exopolysaccharide synthesis family protein
MVLSKLRRRAPRDKDKGNNLSDSLITIRSPTGPSAEAYRALRTSLLYAYVDSSPRVIVITSPGRGDGKTTTCANLGVALSHVNSNTLIVDCDLRQPAMHKVFALRNLFGLVNVLVGEYELQEACHEPLPGLKVLTAGPVPPTPTELLSSKQFAEFIDRARHQFESVLIDVPPLELVSDPIVVARHSDGALLVLDAQGTRKVSVRQGVRNLEAVGAKVLGTVMNNTKMPRRTYHDYAYEA